MFQRDNLSQLKVVKAHKEAPHILCVWDEGMVVNCLVYYFGNEWEDFVTKHCVTGVEFERGHM